MLIKSTFCVFLFTVGTMARTNKTLRQRCDPYQLPINCDTNQACSGTSNNNYFACYCLRDHVESDGDCVKITTTAAASIDPMNQSNNKTSSGSSVAVGLLIPTFLIIIGGIGFFCAKKYRLLPCRRNIYGNVLVTRAEDDDDDPPIA